MQSISGDYKMTSPEKIVNKIIGKPRFRKGDRDGDGVVNSKDCEPDNTMRQDPVDIAARGLRGLNQRMAERRGR